MRWIVCGSPSSGSEPGFLGQPGRQQPLEDRLLRGEGRRLPRSNRSLRSRPRAKTGWTSAAMASCISGNLRAAHSPGNKVNSASPRHRA